MKHTTTKKINTGEKPSPNYPSVPKNQGDFEKRAKFGDIFVTCRINKGMSGMLWSVVVFQGGLEGLALSQPLMYFFYSRGWT